MAELACLIASAAIITAGILAATPTGDRWLTRTEHAITRWNHRHDNPKGPGTHA